VPLTLCRHCEFGIVDATDDRCAACGKGADEELARPVVLQEDEAIDALVAHELVAEFTITGLQERGRSAMLYHAHDLVSDLPVVLKCMIRVPAVTPAERERFQEVVASAAALEHPQLVGIHRAGVSESCLWYTTATTVARTLEEGLVRSGPLDLPAVRRIAQQVAGALDYAHRRGIIHGNLTPRDVLLFDTGWVKLLDVGIGPALMEPPDLDRADSFAALTPPGMGPDQVGLARLIRACLTGDPSEETLPASVPAHVATTLARALSERPADRYPDLLALAAALDGTPMLPRPLRPIVRPRGVRTERGWPEGLEDDATPPAPTPTARWGIPAAVGAAVAISILLVARGLMEDGPTDLVSPSPIAAEIPVETFTPAPPPAPARVVSAPASTPAPRPTPKPAGRAAPRPGPTPPRPTPSQRDSAVVLPPPPEAAPATGFLSVSSRPWASVAIDGRPMGDTPLLGLILSPGRHQVRLTRDGFEPRELTVDVAPGQTVVLASIVLKEISL
jgi:PEGA domain-containing protein/protein kinase-like protein